MTPSAGGEIAGFASVLPSTRTESKADATGRVESTIRYWLAPTAPPARAVRPVPPSCTRTPSNFSATAYAASSFMFENVQASGDGRAAVPSFLVVTTVPKALPDG